MDLECFWMLLGGAWPWLDSLSYPWTSNVRNQIYVLWMANCNSWNQLVLSLLWVICLFRLPAALNTMDSRRAASVLSIWSERKSVMREKSACPTTDLSRVLSKAIESSWANTVVASWKQRVLSLPFARQSWRIMKDGHVVKICFITRPDSTLKEKMCNYT